MSRGYILLGKGRVLKYLFFIKKFPHEFSVESKDFHRIYSQRIELLSLKIFPLLNENISILSSWR